MMEEEEAREVPARVKIASLQGASIMGNIEHNIERFSNLCKIAASNGAKFLVLPETSITGYLSQDIRTNWRVPGKPMDSCYSFEKNPARVAETVTGRIVKHFTELSASLQVYITVPFLEVDDPTADEPVYYNTICLASPLGKVVAHYRKNYIWPVPEKSWATAGTELATYETEYGKIGLAICFDIHSILARYAREDIWLLLYPIAWVGNVQTWFRDELPKNLRGSKVPFSIAGCNWSVDQDKGDWPGYGFSTIYGPCGSILASSGLYEGNDIIYAAIPTSKFTGNAVGFDYHFYQKEWNG